MNKKKIFVCTILAVVAITIITIAAKKIIKKIHTQIIPFNITYDIASKPDFYVYDKYIYYCTKDALKIEDSNNELIASDTYTISYPYLVANESVVAVTEENGYEIRIYNEEGLLYEITSNDPVISVSVNNKGYCCAISKASNMYKFDLYKPMGNGEYKQCIHGEFPEEQNIPFASAVDNDNEMFALSVIDLSSVKVKTNVCFYYYDENNILDAQTSTDSDCMLSSYSEDNNLTGIIKFMNNGKFISVSDSKLICQQINIKGTEKRTELWSVDFKNKITAVNFINNNYVAVAYGERTTTSEGTEEANTVVIYDLSGKRTGSFKAEREITNITSHGNIILCTSGRTLYCIDTSGRELWNYSHTQDILSAFPFLGQYHTFIADDTSASVYNMPYTDKAKIIQEDDSIEETTETSTNTVSLNNIKASQIFSEVTTLSTEFNT